MATGTPPESPSGSDDEDERHRRDERRAERSGFSQIAHTQSVPGHAPGVGAPGTNGLDAFASAEEAQVSNCPPLSSLPITKYPITTRLTTDHRPRYRYRRDSRRCKPRGSTCKPRGTPAGSTSAVSPTARTNQSSENSWATRWRRCVHLNLFLVIFGYFWLFLVIFVRSIRLNHSMCVLSLTGWRNVAGVRSGE